MATRKKTHEKPPESTELTREEIRKALSPNTGIIINAGIFPDPKPGTIEKMSAEALCFMLDVEHLYVKIAIEKAKREKAERLKGKLRKPVSV